LSLKMEKQPLQSTTKMWSYCSFLLWLLWCGWGSTGAMAVGVLVLGCKN
jgi:hypothetical protein